MTTREAIPGSFVYSPEEIYFIKEKAPANNFADRTLGEFFILLGISSLAVRIFPKNRRLDTAIALSAVGLGLKFITQDNTNEQSPVTLSFPPAEARRW